MGKWYDDINNDKYADAETVSYQEKPNSFKNKMIMAENILKKNDTLSIKGAGIGIVSGFLFALLFKKNIILFSSLGAAVGGLGANIIKSKTRNGKIS